jgi:hypothetical protein
LYDSADELNNFVFGRWRKMRRAGHEGLGKTAMGRYYQIQQTEALIFTENLLQNSSQWYQEVYR